VRSLSLANYRPVGLDFAQDTLRLVKAAEPGLVLTGGDVFCLPFPDSTFDGYWSMGVIEHFWDGYEPILAEAARVLKPGGYLFLTHPWICPLRWAKIRRGAYAVWDSETAPEGFFQFLLSDQQTDASLAAHDFQVVHRQPLAGYKGLKDEWERFREPLQRLHDSPTRNPLLRLLRKGIDVVAQPFASHSVLKIARLREDSRQ